MDDETPKYATWRQGPIEWSADFTCEKCGWPWHLRGISETQVIDIEQTIQCPNCGQKFTMVLHHE